MRFIQMWFFPSVSGLAPSVEQRKVERTERTDRLVPLVSMRHHDALFMHSDAEVHSCFLRSGKTVKHHIKKGRGGYLYVLEGGGITVNGHEVPVLGALKAIGILTLTVTSRGDSELLLVDVMLE